jgi:TonB family protein
VSWNDLPEPPRALVHPAPKLSVAAAERLTRRPVVVSFVIDAKGVARVPVVDASIDEETASAVVDAVRQWRFAPPRHDGQPVVVQVSRAFGGTEVHR